MAETKHKVRTFLTNYLCDFCQTEYVKWTGVCLTSNPPRYEHVCQGCKKTTTLSYVYPKTDYEYEDDNDL